MERSPTYLLDCYPRFAEAARLADLWGVFDDLGTVLSYCALLEEQVARNVREFLIWDAVASSAVVMYSRCFAKGWREPLQHDLLNEAPSDLIKSHGFFIELRNKHIAHSVNSFEENLVLVRVGVSGATALRVEDVQIRSRRFMAIEAGEVSQLRAVTEWLRQKVEDMYDVEHERVLEMVKALSLPEIVAQRMEPPLAFMVPGSIGRRRSK